MIMRPEDKVIKAFYDLKKRTLLFSQIKYISKLSDSSLASTLRQMIKNNFLKKEDKYYVAKSTMSFRFAAFDNARIIEPNLRLFISKCPDELAFVLLFGSSTKGKGNDYDILVVTEKKETIFGPVNSPSLNNAPLAGAQDVLKIYAQQISDSIQKDGFYIRVPSGKQFYLYVLQTLDRADASLGGTTIPVTQETDETTKITTTP